MRKLFCEISPLCYDISVFKCCMLRRLRDFFSREHFCRKRSEELLPVVVYKHKSLIRRQCIDKVSGKVIKEKLIKTNHAQVMYDEKYITSNRGNYE